MSFKDIAQIAASAMAAQTVRLNTIASNLANADSAAGTEEAAYRARKPVFASVFKMGADGEAASASVKVLDVVKSTEPLRKVYQPGNPLADEEGNVLYPNVNPIEEMTDMLSATRAYSTNVEVLGRVNNMQLELLKLGQ
ncbi:flagellar basal-body rod protein FlgC [Burkholderia diffusa]|uniref:Flagellar basal-body rod protein FlgC n=1 Tax=Burkholderia diffusa TaxID=488732 RepID=A0AAW3P7Q3_9BURK|nr:flagellar basal body rod protein FlgC [Burkholderia diffusa]KVN02981.1 flagellar basal-body rod protein FlgC [Burkholderia diffusa]KWF41381.1 flagellar basal-body rod protein FlgC [Burkholderia diffusa]KWF44207.1 flagellar basal-body rod protein FlgC [Burkholderia diffusa]KWF45115.1 flagellar basal-body rod protein FlgC [Burkholderia diffusa]KWF51098.1 flagellar basal-body rod protein FlgC [Burkholderia diffusa]